jgi:D-methionine transport system substrate-binding protein
MTGTLSFPNRPKVPAPPIGAYSHKFRSLAVVRDGAIVSLLNDVMNQARAIVRLEQIGWVTLKHSATARESDNATGALPRALKPHATPAFSLCHTLGP